METRYDVRVVRGDIDHPARGVETLDVVVWGGQPDAAARAALAHLEAPGDKRAMTYQIEVRRHSKRCPECAGRGWIVEP